MQAYAKSRVDAPGLVDLVLATMDQGDPGETGAPAQGTLETQVARKPNKRSRIYEDHRPMSVIEQGIRDKTLFQVYPFFRFIPF